MIPNDMKVNGVKIEGLEALSPSQPAEINIHFHQESALPHVLKAGKSLFQHFVECPGILGSRTTMSRLQLATWTTQIILGVMSVALGVFILLGPVADMWFFGAPFLTGAVATIAGVVAIIQKKRRSSWWSFLKVLFVLATISISIAAVVFGIRDINRNPLPSLWYICRGNHAYPTASTEEIWNQKNCSSLVSKLQNLFHGIRVMLFVTWITLLVVTLVSIGLPPIQSCFSRQSDKPPEEDKDKKKLLDGELNSATPCQ
ncbi:transmembrane protein 176A-like [Gracilinanus agilis]|uniref:transmembrane protein 176A-like n=1 Tax=Gracilinanus agilis TaxID=191870 RepID=UPI001CFC7CA6|nr:transmembrane protein 176A-like [Gracilinanus agilis]XP_044533404.1 transmembrane protein 176A-like [Gracilinanus agilis]